MICANGRRIREGSPVPKIITESPLPGTVEACAWYIARGRSAYLFATKAQAVAYAATISARAVDVCWLADPDAAAWEELDGLHVVDKRTEQLSLFGGF
jgi:hypothetical protein